jgi:hypothetical protein
VENKSRKICSKRVLWDGRSMSYHLSKHNLTPGVSLKKKTILFVTDDEAQ